VGDLHVSVFEASHLVATYGIARWLSASVGTTLPWAYADQARGNLESSLRGGLSVGEHLSATGGFHLYATQGGHTTGQLSAAVTWSVPDLDVTIYAGPSFAALGAGVPSDHRVGCAISASWTVAPWATLISENWVDYQFERSLHLAALRIGLGRFALDVGAGASSQGRLYPWLGFTGEFSP
jgi:hypothetical protein